MESIRLIPREGPKVLLSPSDYRRLQEIRAELEEIVRRGQARAQEAEARRETHSYEHEDPGHFHGA